MGWLTPIALLVVLTVGGWATVHYTRVLNDQWTAMRILNRILWLAVALAGLSAGALAVLR
jgi:hypothetical protein